MPLPGYEPFLRAICENPEDDTVRLVYADWLDENGDPERAEFIRLHVARGRANERGPRSDPRIGRGAEILQKHGDVWRAELAQIPEVTWGRFLRGFVSEAIVDRADILLSHGNALFAATPIQFLNLRACDDGTAPEVFRLPALDKIRGVRVAVDLRSTTWNSLISSQWFTNLRHLIVDPPPHRMERADRRALLRLARSPCFPRLELLHIELSIGSSVRDELAKRFRRVTGAEEGDVRGGGRL